MHRKILTVTAAFGLIMSALSAEAQFEYRATPVVPGNGAGINNQGDVVGTLSANHHAFLYKNGKLTDLGVFSDPKNPPNYTEGNAVNDSDEVVGNIVDHGPNGTSAGRLDAFLWRKGSLIDIAQGTTDGGAQAKATAINNRGDIVGTYDAGPTLHLYPGFGFNHAFLYRNSSLLDLGTLGGNFSNGFDINSAGQIVGTSTVVPGFPDSSQGYNAFLYTNGKMHALGGAQSGNFTPAAINDHGWIAGKLVSAAATTAVLYVNGHFINLGTVEGFLGSEGVSINDSGTVVGNLLGDAESAIFPPFTFLGVTGGFVYYGGRIHNLSRLIEGNWNIVSVGHVNDAGQIVATGTRPGSTVTYAILLSPTHFLGCGSTKDQ